MSFQANSTQREEEKAQQLVKQQQPQPPNGSNSNTNSDIIKCDQCNGKGKWEQCSLCKHCMDGIQNITCIACNGMKICVRCNGTSIFKTLKKRCPDCTPGIGDHPTHMLQQPCTKCNTRGSVSVKRVYVNTVGVVTTQSTNHQCIACNGQGFVSDYHNRYQNQSPTQMQIENQYQNQNHRNPSNCRTCNGRRYTLTHLKCSGCINERDSKCGACHGLGAAHYSCDYCQGNGYIFEQGNCVKCNGRGFQVNDGRVNDITHQMSTMNMISSATGANNVQNNVQNVSGVISQPIGIQCGMCGGDGKCVTCSGTGYYVSEMRMCLTCDGDGRFPRLHAWVCVRCKGRGHFYHSEQMCKVCAGSRRFPNNEKQQNVCQKCKGYGRSLFQIPCRACNFVKSGIPRHFGSNGQCVGCQGMGCIGLPYNVSNVNVNNNSGGRNGNGNVSGLHNLVNNGRIGVGVGVGVGGNGGNEDEKVSEGYGDMQNGKGTRLCERYGIIYCPETDETNR